MFQMYLLRYLVGLCLSAESNSIKISQQAIFSSVVRKTFSVLKQIKNYHRSTIGQ